jgi:hypothetical protein
MENEATQVLADAIYWDKVRRARATSLADRFMAGFELLETSLGFTRAGIAHQLGTDDDAEIAAELQRRFDVVRRVNERGLYQTVIPNDA